ncbi:MAG: hypothetical protein Roseis2KO_32140 [Roseivirga sp.]
MNSIGAYWFDDLQKVKKLATLSARITHTNSEAISGAIAVAVATAIASRSSLEAIPIKSRHFIEEVVEYLPPTDTQAKIAKALTLSRTYHPDSLSSILGNGSQMLAQDTVPFVIWCAAHYSQNFEEALWRAVAVLGDRDTICAMVGGITIMSAPESTVPQDWLKSVEDYETSIFRHTT